jgi:predicted RNA-binding Zn-ribbon protein involved in translation (DUF1610 family)
MKKKHRGSFALRLLIFGFSVAVGMLTFWLLGYLLRDIDRIEGPSYDQMLAADMPPGLQAQRVQVSNQLEALNRQIESTQQRRRLTGQTTDDTQETINQLLELKRLASEQQQPLSEEQQQALTENLQLFLSNQRQTQQLNEELIALNDQLEDLQQQQQATQQLIEQATAPIRDRYQMLAERHQWRLAAMKLALLIPLLIVAAWLLWRYGGGAYAALWYAIGAAVAARVILVMHQHFPAIYFRYILILLSLAICVAVLVRLLRLLARPSRDWLLRQYRESYATFFCPVCEHPIQRGPLKYAYWTRRSLKKFSLRKTADPHAASDPAYTCPSCTTPLYSQCERCGGTRHSLLPACQHCGAEIEAPKEGEALAEPGN